MELFGNQFCPYGNLRSHCPLKNKCLMRHRDDDNERSLRNRHLVSSLLASPQSKFQVEKRKYPLRKRKNQKVELKKKDRRVSAACKIDLTHMKDGYQAKKISQLDVPLYKHDHGEVRSQEMDIIRQMQRQRNRLDAMFPVYGHDTEYKKTGLRNIGGNSCYLNAVLQCLLNTEPLMKAVMPGRTQIKYSETKNLSEELWFLYLVVKSGNYRYISPTHFKSTFEKLCPSLAGNSQHDAHETLLAIVDQVEMEIEIQNNATSNDLPSCLNGVYTTTLQCKKCGDKTQKDDKFRIMHLNIPSKGRITLQECMYNLEKVEVILERRCVVETCGSSDKTFKSVKVSHPPEVLIIQLKRFGNESGTTWRNKANTYVDFPMKMDVESSTYRLYAAINHIGSQSSGHYTAQCEDATNPGTWHCYDDKRTWQIPGTSVNKGGAYILFYQKETSTITKEIQNTASEICNSEDKPLIFEVPTCNYKLMANQFVKKLIQTAEREMNESLAVETCIEVPSTFTGSMPAYSESQDVGVSTKRESVFEKQEEDKAEGPAVDTNLSCNGKDADVSRQENDPANSLYATAVDSSINLDLSNPRILDVEVEAVNLLDKNPPTPADPPVKSKMMVENVNTGVDEQGEYIKRRKRNRVPPKWLQECHKGNTPKDQPRNKSIKCMECNVKVALDGVMCEAIDCGWWHYKCIGEKGDIIEILEGDYFCKNHRGTYNMLPSDVEKLEKHVRNDNIDDGVNDEELEVRDVSREDEEIPRLVAPKSISVTEDKALDAEVVKWKEKFNKVEKQKNTITLEYEAKCDEMLNKLQKAEGEIENLRKSLEIVNRQCTSLSSERDGLKVHIQRLEDQKGDMSASEEKLNEEIALLKRELINEQEINKDLMDTVTCDGDEQGSSGKTSGKSVIREKNKHLKSLKDRVMILERIVKEKDEELDTKTEKILAFKVKLKRERQINNLLMNFEESDEENVEESCCSQTEDGIMSKKAGGDGTNGTGEQKILGDVSKGDVLTQKDNTRTQTTPSGTCQLNKTHHVQAEREESLQVKESENKPAILGTCITSFKNGPGKCPNGEKCQYEHDIDFKKVNRGICAFEFAEVGGCSYGEKCMFTHEFPHELRTDKQTEEDMNDVMRRIKKRGLSQKDTTAFNDSSNDTPVGVCMEAFVTCIPEQCSKGLMCTKNHKLDFQRVRKGPCVHEYFNKKSCQFKEKCIFSHEIPEELRKDPVQRKKMDALKHKIGSTGKLNPKNTKATSEKAVCMEAFTRGNPGQCSKGKNVDINMILIIKSCQGTMCARIFQH